MYQNLATLPHLANYNSKKKNTQKTKINLEEKYDSLI